MSYLEKLLDGAQVKITPLATVADIKRGTSITRKAATHGEVPVIAGGRAPAYYHNRSNRTGETIVIAGSGAYAGFVSFWDRPIFVSDAFTVHPHSGLLSKYCFYWLQGMQQELYDLKSGTGVAHVFPRDVARFQIPIPCPECRAKSIAIQSEIVRILDALTSATSELTNQLTHELTARKNHHDNCREQLFCFDDRTVEWKTLGELCHVTSGGTPSTAKREYWDGGQIPWLKSECCDNESVHSAEHFITELGLKNSSARILPRDTTLIALVGATIFKTAYLEFDAATNQNIAGIKSMDGRSLDDKYIFYYITSLYHQLKRLMHNYSMLNLSTLKQFKVPVPFPGHPEQSLAEQRRIVAILDKLRATTVSIGEGLTREIALRQKQVEYCRDLLLRFPKPTVAL